MQLQQGQRVQLHQLSCPEQFQVSLVVQNTSVAYDFSAFLTDEQGKLLSDDDMVFYNQKTSSRGEVVQAQLTPHSSHFSIDLSKAASRLQRISFTLTREDGAALNTLDAATVTLSTANKTLATFPFSGKMLAAEKALIVFEIYLKDRLWRVSAVAQGFNGGLPDLVKYFGAEVAATPPATKAPKTKLSLTKLTLEKQGAQGRISLSKSVGSQPIHINLNWEQIKKSRSFMDFFDTGRADLDLGCMCIVEDIPTVIQALGQSFGSQYGWPYIHLDKDDRSGATHDGENLTIYRPDLIDNVLVYAFIYEGTSTFQSVNARIRITDPKGNEITVQLSNPDPQKRFCAIAMINRIGDDIVVTKEERYFSGHKETDRHYGFGFEWTAGSK